MHSGCAPEIASCVEHRKPEQPTVPHNHRICAPSVQTPDGVEFSRPLTSASPCADVCPILPILPYNPSIRDKDSVLGQTNRTTDRRELVFRGSRKALTYRQSWLFTNAPRVGVADRVLVLRNHYPHAVSNQHPVPGHFHIATTSARHQKCRDGQQMVPGHSRPPGSGHCRDAGRDAANSASISRVWISQSVIAVESLSSTSDTLSSTIRCGTPSSFSQTVIPGVSKAPRRQQRRVLGPRWAAPLCGHGAPEHIHYSVPSLHVSKPPSMGIKCARGRSRGPSTYPVKPQ